MSQIDAIAPGPIPLADAAATAALGRRLAALLMAHTPAGATPLLLLRGPLGAGKTCLVQGLAEALGIEEAITSPTYTLAQHYNGRLPDGRATALVHLDLYRLEQPAAADELLQQEEEEAAALGAVLAVEWPERLSLPPAEAWQLELAPADPLEPDRGRLALLSPPAPPPG